MTAPAWRRVEPGPCDCHHPPQEHDRWEIHTVAGNRLVTDFAIRTYGRPHIERLLSRMFADPALCVPLPEQAWEVLR